MRSKHLLYLVFGLLLTFQCRTASHINTPKAETQTPLDKYVHTVHPAFKWEVKATIPGEGYTTYAIRFVSQHWLTTEEVNETEWWHWLTVTVPDGVKSNTSMLFIGGGNRQRNTPDKPDAMMLQAALATQTVTAALHGVPNQKLTFKNDPFGPREEDEIISYGWRKFLEGGAQEKDAIWLARLPMTTAAVRALDVLQQFSQQQLPVKLEQFVISGASKRGWTTWTTGAVDKRVIGIAPIVIDLLNLQPSFQHHWRAYGRWAPAVEDYDREGIMEWQGSKEYAKMLQWVEPFAYRDRLIMPKMIINATGDQFFLPDSWQYYWKELKGEKHLRYVPNSEHSMRQTDAVESLISFYQYLVDGRPRPEFDFSVEGDQLKITTQQGFKPASIQLWSVNNPDARNFMVDVIGRNWKAAEIPLQANGRYSIPLPSPAKGWTAYFAELTFQDGSKIPLKLSTGVVVRPDTYPHEAFVSKSPKGQRGK